MADRWQHRHMGRRTKVTSVYVYSLILLRRKVDGVVTATEKEKRRGKKKSRENEGRRKNGEDYNGRVAVSAL